MASDPFAKVVKFVACTCRVIDPVHENTACDASDKVSVDALLLYPVPCEVEPTDCPDSDMNTVYCVAVATVPEPLNDAM